MAFYYGMVSVLMIANIGFCLIEKEEIDSLRNMIGKTKSIVLYVLYKEPSSYFQEFS